MECPLCKHAGLDVSVNVCPSCKADLSAYHDVDTIEVSLKKQKKNTLIFMTLFIIAVLACVAIFFLKGSEGTSQEDEKKITECTAIVDNLKAENQQLKQSIAEVEAKNAQLLAVKEEPVPEDITHEIKEGESLFMIAKKYLGNGDLYAKIAEDNGIKDPDLIIAGTVIIIKK